MQEAFGETWVLYDMGSLVAMLVCLITYAVYVQTLVQFRPQNTYEVYDSLGAAQARVLLPKKVDEPYFNSKSLWSSSQSFCEPHQTHALRRQQADVLLPKKMNPAYCNSKSLDL